MLEINEVLAETLLTGQSRAKARRGARHGLLHRPAKLLGQRVPSASELSSLALETDTPFDRRGRVLLFDAAVDEHNLAVQAFENGDDVRRVLLPTGGGSV